MRRPRAVVVDTDRRELAILTRFFAARGYDTAAFGSYAMCPVYGGLHECSGPHPCGDLMIMHFAVLPAMRAVDTLRWQQERGCQLTALNKAVIVSLLPKEGRASLDLLGAKLFLEPLDLDAMRRWVDACETRMLLDRPVAIRRKEHRKTVPPAGLSLSFAGRTPERATVVNRSVCGLCVRTSVQLIPNQLTSVLAEDLGINDDALVRWVRRDGKGSFLAGLSLCV